MTTGVAGLGLVRPAGTRAASAADPDAVLTRLLGGNRRFMSGETSLLTRRRPADFAALAEGQVPEAIILTCSDSRVPPELIFDQGGGDLFVVRVASNVASGAGPIVAGRIEFAVAVLGARLILVLGHSHCGAVKSAMESGDDHHRPTGLPVPRFGGGGPPCIRLGPGVPMERPSLTLDPRGSVAPQSETSRSTP